MPTKPYTCTPAKFAYLKQDLADAGSPITYTDASQNSGSFQPPSHKEITVGFAYNGVDTLTLSIPEKAWYETADEVWNGLAPYLT